MGSDEGVADDKINYDSTINSCYRALTYVYHNLFYPEIDINRYRSMSLRLINHRIGCPCSFINSIFERSNLQYIWHKYYIDFVYKIFIELIACNTLYPN